MAEYFNGWRHSLLVGFIFRDLTKNWIRTILSISGIAIGIGVVLAISLANATALNQFKKTVDLISGKTNLELRPATATYLDEQCLEEIRWLWMTDAKFTATLSANVVLNDRDKTIVQLIGIDMLADRDFANYHSNESETVSSMQLLESGGALVGARLAEDHHLRVGSTIELLANESVHELKVKDVLPRKGIGAAFSGNMVIADLRTAQDLLGAQGKISQVNLIVPDDKLKAVKEKLRQDLPPTTLVERPSQRGEQIEKMTRSFECNLLALTFIALMVGMYLIYNTMTISVIRRRSEIGTLRALGVSRHAILSLFVLEAISFGTLGAAIGVCLGLVLSHGALAAIAGTYEHFYIKQPLEKIEYDAGILLGAFLLGVAATVLASIYPAIEAASVQPAEATRRGSYETKVKRRSKVLALVSLLLLLMGVFACALPPIEHLPLFGYLAALSWVVGCSLLMPILLSGLLPVLADLLEQLNFTEGRLAARSLEGAIGRTSVACASLMIGIAMMVSLSIMVGSFRQTVMVWIDQTLRADLWVQPLARAYGSPLSRMQESTLEKLRRLPEVAAIDGFVEFPIEYHGEPTNLAAGDFEVVGKFGNLAFTSGEANAKVCARVQANDAVVSESFAIRKSVRQGDIIHLDTPGGQLAVKVQGIYYDYASDLGYIVIRRDVYARYFKDTTLSSCAIYLSPNCDPNVARTKILRILDNKTQLYIRTTKQLRTEALHVFDRTFSITYALHSIAIVVAMLAVANALFALTLESKRDFAILRYLGASGGQLKRIVLTQAVLLGTVGNITGTGLGLLLSLLLIYVINMQSFGWTIQLSIPWTNLFQSSILIVVTAAVAGLGPAKLAAQTPAPGAVREE